MKRVLTMMCIAVLAFTSCSRDELKEARQMDQINFRSPALTKAVETNSSSDLEESGFFVSAFLESEEVDGSKSYDLYFNNEYFIYVLESYISQTAYYWPSDGSYLKFYAFTPGVTEFGAGAPVGSEDGKLTIEGFSPAENITEQDDFIFAETRSNKEEAYENQSDTGIRLNFTHGLSQIEVKALNTHPRYDISVCGVRLGNFPTGADFILGETEENRWSFPQTPVLADYEGSRSAILLSDEAVSIMPSDGDNAMVIPQKLNAWDPSDASANTGAYIGVKLNIKTKAAENAVASAQAYPFSKNLYDWVAVPIDTDLAPGKKYTFTLDFTNGAGYVAPKVDDSNNIPGTRIGNDVVFIDVTVSGWQDEIIIKRNDTKITGTWKAYRFYEEDYDEDGNVTGTTDWDAVSNPDHLTNLKNRTQQFYYFKIRETGEEVIPLNEDGTEKAGTSFSYDSESGVFKIPTLQTDAQLIDVKDGKATILLDFTLIGRSFKQWIYYTIEQ